MTLQIKSINSLEVKELMLAILLSTLIHESVQAQSVFSITRPSIQTPSVTITRPSIQTPSVIQLPTEFIVKSADGITPSYVSASKKNNDLSITETGTGDKTIPITPLPPNTPGTLSTINV
ncbi:MAG: hypothetical protein ACK44G_13615, partial [Aphanizomenon sp.]